MFEIVFKENKVLKDENIRFKELYVLFDKVKVEKVAAEERVKSFIEFVAFFEKFVVKKLIVKMVDLEK